MASRCRASPAAGSASRRSRETVESSASIYSRSRRASRSCCRTISRCRRAACNIRWPDPPLDAGAAAAWPEDGTPSPPSPAPTSSTASCSTAKPARLGIVATGKAYLDLRQALADLGHHRRRRAATRPAHLQGRADLAAGRKRRAGVSPKGLQDVLVVEEKRGFIEDQLMRILYNMDASQAPDRRRQARRARRARCCRAKAS